MPKNKVAANAWRRVAKRLEEGDEAYMCWGITQQINSNYGRLSWEDVYVEKHRLCDWFYEDSEQGQRDARERDGGGAWWGLTQLYNENEPARSERVLAAGFLAAIAELGE